MAEAEVCQAYETMIREVGLEVDVREVTPGRNNLYVLIAGRGDSPALMLNGHLHTVPMGPARPPGRQRVYGRGTTDMKGDMAAALIDRLLHDCHIVNIRGNSYQMRAHQDLLHDGVEEDGIRAGAK